MVKVRSDNLNPSKHIDGAGLHCWSKGTIIPTLNLQERDSETNKQFIRAFNLMNNFDCTLRLIMRDKNGSEEKEEFAVNWGKIWYLTKDLSQLNTYNLPVILFSFSLKVQSSNKFNRSFRKNADEDKGIMYFTTYDLWEKLIQARALPDQITDPIKIKNEQFRYMKIYDELNHDQKLNDLRFMNLYDDLQIYLMRYRLFKSAGC